MSTADETEASVTPEIPVGNPEDVAKNPNALKGMFH